MYIIDVADKHYYGFVWDENKAAINKQKHGISFEIAVLVFQDPMLLEIYDIDSSGDEDCYDVIGSVLGRLITFVVYTERNQEKRIISARPATSFERRKYYENIASLQS